VGIGTLSLAGVTAFTAGIAAFQERIRQFFTRARLTMEIRMHAPDTTQIDGNNPQTGAFIMKLLYVRIRVSHRKGRPAENVEVMATEVWERVKDGPWETVRTFLPLTLAWSHVRTPNMRVPAGLFRFCDLGRFQTDANGQTVFVFDTIVQPNAVAGGIIPNALLPGEYRFELVLGGDNTNRVTKRWLLKFGPDWSDDEETMLSRVSVTPAPRLDHLDHAVNS
jgi:hypothetical protein